MRPFVEYAVGEKLTLPNPREGEYVFMVQIQVLEGGAFEVLDKGTRHAFSKEGTLSEAFAQRFPQFAAAGFRSVVELDAAGVMEME